MVVYKFGGATTRTKRGLEALVALTREAHTKQVTLARKKRSEKNSAHGVVLVISAIGHTTRHLLRCAELAEQGRLIDAEDPLSKTLAQHEQLAASLHLESEEELKEEFQKIATSVRSLMEGIAITRELSLRTRDAVIANGELFAAALIEALLHEHGLPVRFIDARKIIVTDENFGHANPLIEEIDECARTEVLPRLRKSEIVLTQGFVGSTRDGVTTTMGSESSDLTATLLAGALSAEEVVVWKMVSGIYTADPEIVAKAKPIKTLDFEEAEELGRRGARVLYPAIARPLIREDNQTVVRVSAPFSKTSRSTTLQRRTESTLSTAARAEASTGASIGKAQTCKPLAVTLEQHLVPIRLIRRSVESVVPPATRRMRERAWEIVKGASVVQWSSGSETTVLLRRDQKSSIVQEIDKEEFVIDEQPAVSAVSIVVRNPANEAGVGPMGGIMLKSLRAFNVRTLLPIEKSIVAIVEDAQGPDALKKLHHDLFEA